MRLVRGLLLKPILNLLTWILKRQDGNSLVGGGPLGWSWYSTLAAMATDHHGDMTAFGGTHHAHSQLGGVTADQHHAQDHAARHASGQPDAVTLDTSQIGTGQFPLTRLPRAASGQFVEGNGVGADPIYNALVAADIPNLAASKITSGRFTVSRLPAMTDEKIWKGTGGNVEEVDMPISGIWTLLETLSPVNVASISSSTLTAYDMFMIVYRLEVLNTGVSAALCMRFNNDAGNNYGRLLLDMSAAPPVWYYWTADKFKLSQHYSTYKYGAGVVYFPGNLGASHIPIVNNSGFVYTSYHWIAAGKYSASANITIIIFLGEGTNITGKIEIYGKNFA